MIFKFVNILVMVFLSRAEHVKTRINTGIEKLFPVENGLAKPYVCLVCDQFTGPNWSLMGADS